MTVIEASPALTVSYDSTLSCQVVHLPEKPWSNAKDTYYPEEHLDRLDRWPLTLINPSERPTVVRLMFTQKRTNCRSRSLCVHAASQ